MIPQRIDPQDPGAACAIGLRWTISDELAVRLVQMAARCPFPIQIFSGYRTPAHQRELIEKGTGAPVDRSTHTSCPATGADVRPEIAVTEAVKAALGLAGVEAGLRWGGGAPVDSKGIPVHPEWMHFDLGPRSTR